MDTLDQNIRDRIDRESRFIDDLKNGLQEIIRTMKACNRLVKTATPSQKKDIINQIQRATASLRNLSVLNSGTIVNPFRDYATRYIKNEDPNKGRTRIFSGIEDPEDALFRDPPKRVFSSTENALRPSQRFSSDIEEFKDPPKYRPNTRTDLDLDKLPDVSEYIDEDDRYSGGSWKHKLKRTRRKKI
jgi:hypothetical protein